MIQRSNRYRDMYDVPFLTQDWSLATSVNGVGMIGQIASYMKQWMRKRIIYIQ